MNERVSEQMHEHNKWIMIKMSMHKQYKIIYSLATTSGVGKVIHCSVGRLSQIKEVSSFIGS